VVHNDRHLVMYILYNSSKIFFIAKLFFTPKNLHVLDCAHIQSYILKSNLCPVQDDFPGFTKIAGTSSCKNATFMTKKKLEIMPRSGNKLSPHTIYYLCEDLFVIVTLFCWYRLLVTDILFLHLVSVVESIDTNKSTFQKFKCNTSHKN
jgi:hypothetical protein